MVKWIFLLLFSNQIFAQDIWDIEWEVNKEYSDTPNNCLIVAVMMKRRIGRGVVECVNVPKKYLPVKRHCYLRVDAQILDNGGLAWMGIKLFSPG